MKFDTVLSADLLISKFSESLNSEPDIIWGSPFDPTRELQMLVNDVRGGVVVLGEDTGGNYVSD